MALTATFLEGLVFMLICFLGLRKCGPPPAAQTLLAPQPTCCACGAGRPRPSSSLIRSTQPTAHRLAEP
jgi:hypothetical protein